jgi:hypothetical protein
MSMSRNGPEDSDNVKTNIPDPIQDELEREFREEYNIEVSSKEAELILDDGKKEND